jgi:hypothetical protein
VDAAQLLESGCCSLHQVHKELHKLPGFHPGLSYLCKLREKLAPLLLRSFRREVCIYLNSGQNGLPVMGLSEDGREALRLAIEYLAELDRQAGDDRV